MLSVTRDCLRWWRSALLSSFCSLAAGSCSEPKSLLPPEITSMFKNNSYDLQVP